MLQQPKPNNTLLFFEAFSTTIIMQTPKATNHRLPYNNPKPNLLQVKARPQPTLEVIL